MKSQNICKFINQQDQAKIITTNFIYEQDDKGKEEHRYETNAIYLVSDGEGFFKCADKVHKLHKGLIFFSFADLSFIIENSKGLKYYYISFFGNRSDELFRKFGITPANCTFKGYEKLIPFWQDSLIRADSETIDILSESVLLYTFSKLKSVKKSESDTIDFILTYLENNFTDPQLSLNFVASEIGYNPKYLSHFFKKNFGMGFSEYLKLLRLKYAVMLIESGVTSVKNIAILSGFSDPLYFSKVFTTKIGVSPSNYKKQTKGEQ